jgi:hypothetical protein
LGQSPPNLEAIAVQDECDAVVAFLSTTANISKMLQWSLTLTFSEHPDSLKDVRLSTAALCSESSDLAREVRDSELLPQILRDFWSSPAVSSLACYTLSSKLL